MATYTIKWMENKTSSKGTNYIKAQLTDETGRDYPDVAIFSFFSKFNEVKPGASVEGLVKEKMYNGKSSFSLEDIKTFKTFQKPNGIAAAQERKAELIEKSQDRKEESITKAGAQRDAVLIITTFYKDSILTDADIQQKVKEWMKYFMGLQEQPFI